MLENAAREADIVLVDALNDIFLKEWRSYKEKLKDCVADQISGRQEEKEQIEDYTIILGWLERLSEAMEELDIDIMDETMEKLEGFTYPAELQESIEKLSVYVMNMDSEEGILQIKELMGKIKEKQDGGM